MKTYTVYASEVVTFCADVQANSQEEAQQKFMDKARTCVEHLENSGFQIDAVFEMREQA